MKYSLWNNFSDMADFITNPLIITRGEGSYVYDQNHKEYVDAISGIWNVNLGYSRKDIIDYMYEKSNEVTGVSLFGRAHQIGIEYANELLSKLDNDFDAVFYTTGGSDAVETAIKISRSFFYHLGKEEKYKIAHFENSYHGVSYGALSVMGINGNTAGAGPMLPGTITLPKPTSVESSDVHWEIIERKLNNENPDTIAAIIVEPILGAGGIIPVETIILKKLREYCNRHDIILIFDEVVTGFGRTGNLFAYKMHNVKPDLITVAKGITAGYAPLGGVLVSEKIYNLFKTNHIVLRHGFTFGGHPISCAAAYKTLRILLEENVVDHVRQKEELLQKYLLELCFEFDLVQEVRGKGFMYGLKLDNKIQGIAKTVSAKAQENGLLYRPAEEEVVVVMPPLTSDENVLKDIYTKLQKTLQEVSVNLLV
jgi:adenosylmethionine-8-amino-7-oxononanoate aminotransferase